jgi:multidrug resistance efflux pump
MAKKEATLLDQNLEETNDSVVTVQAQIENAQLKL